MASQINGRIVSWGVASAIKTGVHTATTSGIVNNFTVSKGGSVTTVEDEDDETVTRIGHKAENKFSFDLICEPTSVCPDVHDEIAGLGTHDGVNFGTGRTFVDSAEVKSASGETKTFSVSGSHYPFMGADPS